MQAGLKKAMVYLAPVLFLLVVAVFIWNLLTHGRIDHPGKSIYMDKCAQCHGDNGEGIRVLVPPLDSSDFAAAHFDSIPCWLRYGINRPITVKGVQFDQPMYGLPDLDEIQIANLLNYLAQTHLHVKRQVNSQWVQQQLKKCQ